MYKTFNYDWKVDKRSLVAYGLDVCVFDTHAELLDRYYNRRDCRNRVRNNDIVALFIPSRDNGKFIGTIYLSRDNMSKETIIHEAFHAAIELSKRLKRRVTSDRNEERLVGAAAQLASLLVDELGHMSTEGR
jgi:hypothetical protein